MIDTSKPFLVSNCHPVSNDLTPTDILNTGRITFNTNQLIHICTPSTSVLRIIGGKSRQIHRRFQFQSSWQLKR